MKSFTSLVVSALMCLPIMPIFTTSTAKGAIISNGSFESPALGSGWTTVSAGQTALTSWTVLSGSVDVTRTGFGSPYDGLQMLDLDGNSPGAIQQDFPTTIGVTYQLSFAYANNPIFGQVPATAGIEIISSGVQLNQNVTHGSVSSPGSPADYSIFTADFRANASISTLQFFSLDNPSSLGGILIDDVSVTVLPEPASMGILAVGAIALLHRRRK